MHAVHLWCSSTLLQMMLLKSSYCSAFSTCLPNTGFWGRKIKRDILIISKLLQYIDQWKQWLCLVLFSEGKKGTVEGICNMILSVVTWTKAVSHGTSWTVTGQELGAHIWTINEIQCTQSSVLVQAPIVSHNLTGHSCFPFLGRMFFPNHLIETSIKRVDTPISNVFPLSGCFCMQLYCKDP